MPIEQEDRAVAESTMMELWGNRLRRGDVVMEKAIEACAIGIATAREKYQKQLAEERAHADRLAAALAKRLEGDVPPCGWCSYNCGRALLDDKRCCENCSTCAALAAHRKRRESGK